jgi:hypothetical protein
MVLYPVWRFYFIPVALNLEFVCCTVADFTIETRVLEKV